MKIFNKIFLILFVLGFILSMACSVGYASPASRARHRAVEQRQKYLRTYDANRDGIVDRKEKIEFNKHDYNNDGVINQKDRLLWVNKHKNDSTASYISKENEGLLEEIDVDGDGSITLEEIQTFYNAYDSNGDGVLEDIEINAAAD